MFRLLFLTYLAISSGSAVKNRRWVRFFHLNLPFVLFIDLLIVVVWFCTLLQGYGILGRLAIEISLLFLIGVACVVLEKSLLKLCGGTFVLLSLINLLILAASINTNSVLLFGYEIGLLVGTLFWILGNDKDWFNWRSERANLNILLPYCFCALLILSIVAGVSHDYLVR
ncbi:MAG: hypothetical protein KDD62_02625 [Bdellovibrionales bacterium]|nr:hypothetical protein [Bdellovibrionales bacterium]